MFLSNQAFAASNQAFAAVAGEGGKTYTVPANTSP